ncbi:MULTISPECIES: MFS transporter [unclassified Streptomyces]|uniref:MFS transporter n=1 Tax=unclassified Streptomyces TaxID=2593676 RepID=UPI002DDBD46C|nr:MULTISPECIES: MFS transporter [unclassified Streptomyces]WSA97666.1 MFS transporter [Streptomyces sp. NBC_01795]WSB82084.1 MFS transporter [Streptomyces sp. NBC_01775]WSS46817.1 MFS transporter [Streptomyces sp. NBC_01187]WSS46966.1 MFS transporter [Streptomyces sp. NBC_01187]
MSRLRAKYGPLLWMLISTLMERVIMECLRACVWVLMPWFVFAMTGSTSQAGWVLLTVAGASVAGRFLAGPVVDRVGLRRTLWIAGVVEAISVALIALLVVTDRLFLPALLALVAVGRAGNVTSLLVPGAAYFAVDEGRGRGRT